MASSSGRSVAPAGKAPCGHPGPPIVRSVVTERAKMRRTSGMGRSLNFHETAFEVAIASGTHPMPRGPLRGTHTRIEGDAPTVIGEQGRSTGRVLGRVTFPRPKRTSSA